MSRARHLLAGLLVLAGCQSPPKAPLPLAQDVDLDRFMGDWYVIASTPTFIDRAAVDAVESYRRDPDGSIATTYTFRDTGFGGDVSRYTPRGFVVPGTGNAVWDMQFVWPIRADYRIVWLAPDYSQVVVAREKRDYAWIMARTPRIPEAQLEAHYAFLRAHGYEVGKLRRIPHSAAGGRAMSERVRAALRRWVDSGSEAAVEPGDARRIEWTRVVPFLAIHAGCLSIAWVGTSTIAIAIAAALFAVRMFAITAFYHRYFSHRAFRTSRAAQFAFALLGASAAQRGPLWWASHHRHHHAHADRPDDSHSSLQHGFLWSHVGWFLARGSFAIRAARVGDLARFPELRWLDRFDTAVPAALAIGLYALGEWLSGAFPALGTSGAQMVAWGFCISTVALYHATFTINSLAHRFGSRRYATRDDSRNNLWLALLTFGEGWHNNHHHYPASARQGFYWWEVDLAYYGLRVLAALGLVWDLRLVPEMTRRPSE